MAKKKSSGQNIGTAEQEVAQRLAAIREFNLNNAGEMWIDPDKTPTQEDIDKAKEEFEQRTIALRDKKDYLIADAPNALRVAKFLKNFIENAFWTQRYFVGVINFSDYITKFIEECEKEEKDLVMDYGPMQFAFLMCENYAGKGLEDAKKMADMWDEYVPIYDTLRTHVDWYNTEVKQCEKLKQRWGMLSQGYYLVLLDENQEEAGKIPAESLLDVGKENPTTDEEKAE